MKYFLNDIKGFFLKIDVVLHSMFILFNQQLNTLLLLFFLIKLNYDCNYKIAVNLNRITLSLK